MGQTLRLEQEPSRDGFGHSQQIVPVNIVNCAPNTGFLPVISNYGAEINAGFQTNPGAGGNVGLGIPMDGIYDISLYASSFNFSAAEELHAGLMNAGGAFYWERVWRFPATDSVDFSWSFACRALQGDILRVQNVTAITGTYYATVIAIPRTL